MSVARRTSGGVSHPQPNGTSIWADTLINRLDKLESDILALQDRVNAQQERIEQLDDEMMNIK